MFSKYVTKKERRVRRHLRLRKKVAGTTERPRLCVSITTNNMYVQVIDDVKGSTLVSTSTLDPKFKEQQGKPNMAGAQLLGKIVAERAIQAGITEVVFDRGGFRYHGRVKAIAETARSAGLKF
ncbi:MAG: 50S ribosomal protein L18 [Lentisphaerae bacterium GWF2_52_8]|nr:MAG: 50S ribosomal protein L18 [Lentisphaerae bacterium GWF2_52_8]